ncbi:hypothetical protein JAMGFMIE_02245 [Rheinheimera sp. MM224]|nr:hypothetical protein JAMGFMIE_02245 [Rheinheimera sp. MM224]
MKSYNQLKEALLSLCQLFLSLSVALTVFIVVAVGLIVIGDFTCLALGYSEGLCRIS